MTTEDGYYRSGDLARVDADGLVTLQDRQRDLVITGGLNVYPSEVERVLSEHPLVEQVAVVGAPDDEWGESVVAFVVAAGGAPVTQPICSPGRGRGSPPTRSRAGSCS